jgi:hypothetical protein
VAAAIEVFVIPVTVRLHAPTRGAFCEEPKTEAIEAVEVVAVLDRQPGRPRLEPDAILAVNSAPGTGVGWNA